MKKLRLILPFVFLFLLTAFVLDLANPFLGAPARDGGFFLYAGSQILDGRIPYQDFWDSKGPGIFYINALGLLLGGGSRWGVWLVEFLCIFGTLLLLYDTLSKRWGIGAALFGATLAGLGLRVALGYGNYTEEYALLFNAAGLVLFFSMVDVERNYWKYIWVGAFFGLSFTFRANNIGGLIAILGAIALFYGFKRHYGEVLRILLAILVGFVLPLILWTIYFAIVSDAKEMVYASIVFNFSYSAAKEREWLDIFGGFGRYGMEWYGWFTLAAWLLLGLRVLMSFVFAEIWQAAFKVPSLEGWNDGFSVIASAVLIIMLFAISPSSWARYGETIRAGGGEYITPVSAYIRDNSKPGDRLLTWYPEISVNFMSNRASPVKYLYYPLFLDGSLTREIEDSYYNDLTSNPPELILDCSRSVDAIPSLDPATREVQYDIPGVKKKMYIQPKMDEVFEFVEQNYRLENKIDECLIFRLKMD
ncbi:MAG: hypothetical protein EDM79_12870 [Chloroflexi bacterium]|nr:MAG: hypothetical protein EDM79_12870 [Chloroflexota bacterium]